MKVLTDSVGLLPEFLHDGADIRLQRLDGKESESDEAVENNYTISSEVHVEDSDSEQYSVIVTKSHP